MNKNIIPFDNWIHSRFVLNSWLKSFHKAIPNSFTPEENFNKNQEVLIQALLARGAQIKVYTDPTDKNHILGWLCYEVVNNISIIHFIYTKASCRRSGIAKELCKEAGVDLTQPLLTTSITYVTKDNMLGKKYEFIYLPELLNGLLGKCELFAIKGEQ